MKFEEICTFDTLYAAYKAASKGKRKKKQQAEYEQNAVENTLALAEQLKSGIYKPGTFQTFFVYEPKKRLVQAPSFPDKVVQHALVDNGFYDEITQSFITENAASQKEKGTFYALDGLKRDLLTYYRQQHTADGWVLKCDIRHFFASIDHNILKIKLRHRVSDDNVLKLLYQYIDSSAEGLPLGYQTSQLFALLMLDKFDHYVKEKLRVRFYGRYMDDFYLIHPDKEYLKDCRTKITEYLAHLHLELNEKTEIFPLKNGLDYLGFHSYLTESGKVLRKLRRKSVRRIRGKIKRWKIEYPAGAISKEQILMEFEAWDAHAAHGETFALRKQFAEQVSEIIQDDLRIHRTIKTAGHKSQRVRVGRSEKERLDEWYLENVILNDKEEIWHT